MQHCFAVNWRTYILFFSCVFQLRKMSDRVEKNRKDVEATRTKYEAALSDLNSYNAKYMEDMTDVRHKTSLYRIVNPLPV